MTSNIPYELLEERAAQQRRELHNRVVEFRTTVAERLDVNKVAREYLWPAAGVSAVVGLLLGWGLTGMFTGD
jgi:ElaB/YqjD/DUF883 family membrane-anchored ribosome-binding protein